MCVCGTFAGICRLNSPRADKKPEATSSSGKKVHKPVSKLSHDLFGSGSFQDNDSGDLFSPTETAKDLPKATPTPTVAAKPASTRKDSLFGMW